MAKQAKYDLVIYAPGTIDQPLASYSLSGPPPAMSVGDIIDPKGLENGIDVEGWLEVVGVQHSPYQTTEAITWAVLVFTKDVSREDAQDHWND